MNRLAGDLLIKLESRSATTAVIGLGYVGLPLVVEFARAGFNAVGVDVDRSKVDAVSRGRIVHSGRAGARHPAAVNAGRLRATTDFAALRDARHDQHLRADAASKDERLRICRTSSPRSNRSQSTCARVSSSSSNPRRIRERPTKWCSRCSKRTGSRLASDFFLAFSPERVDPGNAQWTTRTIPKVVGGIDADSYDRGAPRSIARVSTRSCRCRRRASPRW